MRLKELRLQKGDTQTQVATAIVFSESAYAKYENGSRDIGYKTLIKLSHYFGVSIDYIVCNDMCGSSK